ncbi:MAG: adenosylcobinamide-GDP ribazoletransferase [Devosia sp.]
MSGDGPGPRIRQDNFREPPPSPPDRGFGADLVMALRFFSRLPTGDRPFEPPDLTRIAVALPFASVIIALGPAALLMLLGFLLPGYFAAALAVGAMLAVTGAMADDALADAADGLVGGATPERRLEIMKDSRHGTYGVAALCLYIVLRVVALGSLAVAHGPAAAAAILVATTVLARSSSLWLSLELPNARAGGVSAGAGRVGRNSFGIGLLFSAIIAFIVAAPFTSLVAVVLAFLVAGLVAWGWTAVCRKLVGGQTGDLIGALQALIEVGVLTVLLAFA